VEGNRRPLDRQAVQELLVPYVRRRPSAGVVEPDGLVIGRNERFGAGISVVSVLAPASLTRSGSEPIEAALVEGTTPRLSSTRNAEPDAAITGGNCCALSLVLLLLGVVAIVDSSGAAMTAGALLAAPSIAAAATQRRPSAPNRRCCLDGVSIGGDGLML
jgi:hypothetical protein